MVGSSARSTCVDLLGDVARRDQVWLGVPSAYPLGGDSYLPGMAPIKERPNMDDFFIGIGEMIVNLIPIAVVIALLVLLVRHLL